MTEAFFCTGVRIPIGRYGGALAAVRPDDMAGHALCSMCISVDQSIALAMEKA